MGKGIYGDRRIARERSESDYSWDTDRDGKTEDWKRGTTATFDT